MSIEAITTDEFETAWLEADRSNRFRYRINRGVIRLYSFLFGLFWAAYGLTVWGKGLSFVLGSVGAVVAVVFVFAIYNIMYWRHYARVSGIITTSTQLIWRNGRTAWSITWTDVDFDASGLTNHSIGTQAVEHHLSIRGKRLDVARMHVEMPRIREFMATFLQRMVESGQIQRGSPSTD